MPNEIFNTSTLQRQFTHFYLCFRYSLCCGLEAWVGWEQSPFRVAPILLRMVPTHYNTFNRAGWYPNATGWEPSPEHGSMVSTQHNGKYRTGWHPVLLDDNHPSHGTYASHLANKVRQPGEDHHLNAKLAGNHLPNCKRSR